MTGMRPSYVAFEGTEGSGKSTHAARYAQATGAVLTRETGGTAIGRRVREILHDTDVTTRHWGGGNGTIQLHRVTDPWPSPMTWNNQPASGELIDTFTSPIWEGWMSWDVAPLYQHYLDTRPAYAWPNNGMRFSSPTAGLTASFSSGEAASFYRPWLTLVYNNLPGPPVLDVPATGFVSEKIAYRLPTWGGFPSG